MSDICLPLPHLSGGQKAEIKVDFQGDNKQIEYRVEVITTENAENDRNLVSDIVFNSLKKHIENYDKNWELVQVFASQDNYNEIKILYRKR